MQKICAVQLSLDKHIREAGRSTFGGGLPELAANMANTPSVIFTDSQSKEKITFNPTEYKSKYEVSILVEIHAYKWHTVVWLFWQTGRTLQDFGLDSGGGGVLSTKLYVDVPAGPRKSEYLYTNFLPNFPPISIPFSKEKHPIWIKLGAFYNNLPKYTQFM